MPLAFHADATEGGEYRSHLLIDSVFSPKECDEIQELGLSADMETARLESTGPSEDLALRRTRVSWIGHTDATLWIHERLAEVCATANECYGFDLDGFTEELQFAVYDEPGSFYTWHQDGLDGVVAGRKLSVVVQLTDPDDYDGANLSFLDVALDLSEVDRLDWCRRARTRGGAIVFPAFEYHEVTPLERGRRTSLVAWIGGPPFR